MSYKVRPYIGSAFWGLNVSNPFRKYEITDDGKLNEHKKVWLVFNHQSKSIPLEGASVEIPQSSSFIEKFRDKGSVTVRGRTGEMVLHKLPDITAFRNAVHGNHSGNTNNASSNHSAEPSQPKSPGQLRELGDTVCVVAKPPKELEEALKIIYGAKYSNLWKKSIGDYVTPNDPLIPYGKNTMFSEAIHIKAPCSGMIISYDTDSDNDLPLFEVLMHEGETINSTSSFFDDVFEATNYSSKVPQNLKNAIFEYFNSDMLSSRPATQYELSWYAGRDQKPESGMS